MILLTILTILLQTQTPKKGIDEGVKRVVSAYTDSLALDGLPDGEWFFVVRSEQNPHGENLVYIAVGLNLSSMLDSGAPNAYSEYNKKLIFIYSEVSGERLDSLSRIAFVKRFAPLVRIDSMAILGWEPEPYRFVLSKERNVKGARRICQFPFPRFLEEGYIFDGDGNLMYNDGIYDTCNLTWNGFFTEVSPMQFLDNNQIGVSLPLTGLGAVMVIDELGKVISVELSGRNLSTIAPNVRSRIVDLLKGMPKWNQGKIRGKPVKYRIHVGL